MAEELSIFESEEPTEVVAEEEPQGEPNEPEQLAEGEAEEGTGEKEAAPPAAAEESEQRHAPLTALLDERERRQKAEAEAKRYRDQVEAHRRQQEEAQQKRPDFFDDPEKRIAMERQEMQLQARSQYLDACEMMVRDKQGDELVDQAYQSFQQALQNQPWIAQEVMSSRNPWAAMVDWHQKQSVMQEIGPDPAAYKEQLREQIRAELAQEMQSQAPGSSSRPQKLPGSLASAPSAGGTEPTAVNAPGHLKALFQS